MMHRVGTNSSSMVLRVVSSRRLQQQQHTVAAALPRRFLSSSNDAAFATTEDKDESSSRRMNSTKVFDVLIVGGGVVGSALARLVQQRLPLLSVGLLEASSSPPPLPPLSSSSSSSSDSGSTSSIPHPRCYALSPRSLQLLGISTSSMIQQHVTPAYYDCMQIWEQDSPSVIVFDASTDLRGTSAECAYLGAVVEDTPLVSALWNQLRQESSTSTMDLLPNRRICHLVVDDDDDNGLVHVSTTTTTTTSDAAAAKKDKDGTCTNNVNNEVDTEQQQQTTYSTRLLVAADGANSWVRNQCVDGGSSIVWEGFDYDRMALTCTVKLNKPMPSRAFQRFLPHGPMALLPTRQSDYATIVWSTTPEEASKFSRSKSSSDDDNKRTETDLVTHANSILQQGPQRIPPLFERNIDNSGSAVLTNLAYGMERLVDTVQYGLTMAHWNDHEEVFMAPPIIESIASSRYVFPLSCKHASSYTAYNNRVVLVGDAAHTVHPMAGQGLNMGLDDVDALVACMERSYDAGMDIRTFLDDYDRTQRLKNTIRQRGIHTLHDIFGNRTTVMQHGKSLGMHAVNHIGPIRKQLAAIATGVV